MRVLILDIETGPNTAYVWSLWDENVNLERLIESTEVLCFSAKWFGDKKTLFHSARDGWIAQAWDLLDEADVVVHYNGKRFDVPHLNREFVEAGLGPPSPYKQVDLFQVVKQRFKFPSNKLAYVAPRLGVGAKVSAGVNFQLWKDVIGDDDKAWRTMERYNRQDVKVTEALYLKLLPWIGSHPSRALYDGVDCCGTCGAAAAQLERRGFAYTPTGKFQRYRCRKCGTWSRDQSRLSGTKRTQAPL